MKRLPLLSSVLALSLAVSSPVALAHVGHGDEFQAEGGVDRVEVNAETDPLLGIQVSPIEAAADGSGAVMIPVSALVEDGDRQLAFVLYENFYEPVPVTTGATVGEMVEILEGLSVGEQLVTQGSLSLYAESRKTQTAEAEAEAVATTSEVPVEAPAAETPEMEPAEMEVSEATEAPAETTEAAGGFPKMLLPVLGGGVGLAIGAVVLTRKK
jgi:cation efflux system membrane fusion protein